MAENDYDETLMQQLTGAVLGMQELEKIRALLVGYGAVDDDDGLPVVVGCGVVDGGLFEMASRPRPTQSRERYLFRGETGCL